MMLVNSIGLIPPLQKIYLIQATTFLLAIALAAMGLQTDIPKLQERAGGRCSLAQERGCSSRLSAWRSSN
jgi:uncharacterized membrane protein YadS